MLQSEDWAPLYRRIFASDEWRGQKPTTKVVLVWIIGRVRHTDSLTTPAGSLDFTLPDLCRECELTTNTARAALDALTVTGFLKLSRIKNGTRATIVTASRWLRNAKPAAVANESMPLFAKAQNLTDENADSDSASLQEEKKDLSSSKKALSQTSSQTLSGYSESIKVFFDLFVEAYNTKPSWRGAADGSQMKRLLLSHGPEEVQRRMRQLFTAPPKWLRPPYTFGTFVRHFDQLVIAPVGPTTAGARRGGLSPSEIMQRANAMRGEQ